MTSAPPFHDFIARMALSLGVSGPHPVLREFTVGECRAMAVLCLQRAALARGYIGAAGHLRRIWADLPGPVYVKSTKPTAVSFITWSQWMQAASAWRMRADYLEGRLASG